ncbi:outer membrane beta-barrel protein [Pedobacter sp. SYP-B3415]|uniref:outer membrane beta-barrel protein n=1 Tax=Pedobacter sp. SYP-B3415 TaxID=2496641 RepID=UPI00101C6D11|nr:outer membrane beta-barrel protein [Pedobacter sp. SYP-B3415]
MPIRIQFYGYLFLLKAILLSFALLCLSAMVLRAQTTHRLSGSLIDSLKNAVPGANVKVISGTDTLIGVTNNDGEFSIRGINTQHIGLIFESIGYRILKAAYTFKEGERNVMLNPIILQNKFTQLKDVEVKARLNPVRIMKDTIEYNAAAYTIRQNDVVSDLLKQMQGIRVDEQGNVSTMGQPLTRLRVNGEDFFTNDVKEFVRQLPAAIIARVQVIEDYGDEANFTGVKTGEPVKLLNLVTKPNLNKGNFGNINTSGGTNRKLGLNASGNLWQDDKQIGLNGAVSSTDNRTGFNENRQLSLNMRNKIQEGLSASANYRLNQSHNRTRQDTYVETVNTIGTIINESGNENRAEADTHNLNVNVQSVTKKAYFQSSLNGSFVDRDNNIQVNSVQRGIIRQDLLTNNNGNFRSPAINGSMIWARRTRVPGRSFSVSLSGNSGLSKSSEEVFNNIGYYDRYTGAPVKDSILNRVIDTRNHSSNVSAEVRYSYPLKAGLDSLVKENIDFSYGLSMSNTYTRFQTRAGTDSWNSSLVDSLSSLYSSLFLAHHAAVNYRYQSPRVTYNIGINAQPSLLASEFIGREGKINQRQFNFSPVARIGYTWPDNKNFSFAYSGVSAAPAFNQLQPVPDARNLQNVIIGNPDLKPSFSHNGNASFNVSSLKTGSTFMFSLNGALVQNQVAANVVLVKDTLNSLKQETRFENTSGNYNVGGMVSYAQPFLYNQLNVQVLSSVNLANNVFFLNDQMKRNERINFAQSVSLSYNRKRYGLSANVLYDYSSNRYAIFFANERNIETWQFNFSANAYLDDGFSAGVNASKSLYSGFLVNAGNPLLINAHIQKAFLKNRQATVALHAYDILNQANNLMRSITENSVTDIRTAQITQYVILTFTMRLNKFGANSM